MSARAKLSSGSMITLSLAHSPDADDMAMWWPLTGMRDRSGAPLSGGVCEPAIDTRGFRFETLAADIQELNLRAIERGDLDITAISAGAYPGISGVYRVTRCGASIGGAYGPKLVASASSRLDSLDAALGACDSGGGMIAIPGRHTTAYLALRVLAERAFPTREMPFYAIPEAVFGGEVAAGLLIHEAQLDPEVLGLRTILELGPAWMAWAGGPLPLGLNVMRRDLDARFGVGTSETVAHLLRESVRYAIDHGELTRAFLLARSDERPEWKEPGLLERYLSMYVNEQTVDMGEEGVRSLRTLFARGVAAGLCVDPGEIDAI